MGNSSNSKVRMKDKKNDIHEHDKQINAKTYKRSFSNFVKNSFHINLNEINWTLPINFSEKLDIEKNKILFADYYYKTNFNVTLTVRIKKIKDTIYSEGIDVVIHKIKDNFGNLYEQKIAETKSFPFSLMIKVGPEEWDYSLYFVKYSEGFFKKSKIVSIMNTTENIWNEPLIVDSNLIVEPIENYIREILKNDSKKVKL